MCSRGCGCSGRRQRALGPQAAAQVRAARIRGGGERVGAGEVRSPSFIPRGLPGWAEVVDTHQTAGRAGGGGGGGATVAPASL